MHILYSFISIFPPLFCLFTMCQTSRVKVPSADRQDVCTVWRRVRACEGTRSPSYKTLPEFRLTTFIRTRGRSLRCWTWEEKWTRFWVVPSQHTDDASSWSKWRWTQPEVSIWTIKIRAEVCDCNLNWSRFLHIHIIVVVLRHIFHLTIYTLFYFVLPESGTPYSKGSKGTGYFFCKFQLEVSLRTTLGKVVWACAEEGPWIYWTTDVNHGAVRQERGGVHREDESSEELMLVSQRRIFY